VRRVDGIAIVFHNQYAFKELRVLFLEVFDRLAFVDSVLEMLLEELQAGAIFLDQLVPSLDADGHIAAAHDQPPFGIGAGVASRRHSLVAMASSTINA
jgi:hypothetical protein